MPNEAATSRERARQEPYVASLANSAIDGAILGQPWVLGGRHRKEPLPPPGVPLTVACTKWRYLWIRGCMNRSGKPCGHHQERASASDGRDSFAHRVGPFLDQRGFAVARVTIPSLDSGPRRCGGTGPTQKAVH